MPLAVGDAAPDLTLPASTLERVALGDLYRRGTTVLLFFPLAFTSTCTEELCTMRDELPVYDGLKATIVGVSVDSPYVLARYREEIGAAYPFLSDFNREAAEAFGVMRDGTVGPGLLGASDRAAFVIDRDGRIRYVWHSTNTSVLPPFDEIRTAAEQAA